MRNLFVVLMLLVFTAAMAGNDGPTYLKLDKAYRYRVYFTDKKHNTYSTRRPEAFLSQKALDRRKKYKIKVDQYDLPVTQLYLEYLNNNGYKVINVSKWNNTAVVEVSDTLQMHKLQDVTFIKDFKPVWQNPDSILVFNKANRLEILENKRDTLSNEYGYSFHQNHMLNTDKLHHAGFKGEGMTVAVIDGGFYNADCILGLKDCKILGTRNFVNPKRNVYEEPQQHGTMVLSCMAANLPHALMGSAPQAAFYLLVSEDNDSENLIEEDNWTAALEYADSLGVDIVTSSLGYYKFDNPAATHLYQELDGHTAINSRSASMAASRGLVVVNSAGNEGDNYWKKIGFPADADHIFTVGAVNKDRKNTIFSSLGNTVDGRIKPDVMAQGQGTWLLDCQGNITMADGTSFSAPLFCGAVTCLMQAFPHVCPEDIIKTVQQAGDNAKHPNNVYGYGIPDMWKAYKLLKNR